MLICLMLLLSADKRNILQLTFVQSWGQNARDDVRSGQWKDLARRSGVPGRRGESRRVPAQRLGYTRLLAQGGRVDQLLRRGVVVDNWRWFFHSEHHFHAFNCFQTYFNCATFVFSHYLTATSVFCFISLCYLDYHKNGSLCGCRASYRPTREWRDAWTYISASRLVSRAVCVDAPCLLSWFNILPVLGSLEFGWITTITKIHNIHTVWGKSWLGTCESEIFVRIESRIESGCSRLDVHSFIHCA